MRVLVTGSQGFVGRHLLQELLCHNHRISAFDLAPANGQNPGPDFSGGDIQDRETVERAVGNFSPEACVHLSGLSSVPAAWQNPGKFFDVNVLGAINLIEACLTRAPSARILVISSAEVYGHRPARAPLTESERFNPDNPYAVSKAAADNLALLYARQYALPVMVARPGNHIGPGQSAIFVVPSFAAQLKAIAAGQGQAVLKVGNLESSRDFTDVRDVARAYRLLIEKGRPGEAYNIGSKSVVSIRFILERLCAIAGVKPAIEIARERYRPTESRPLLDTSKIAKDTGWKPEIELETTLRDIMK